MSGMSKMQRGEILKIIRPAFMAYWGDEAAAEWQALKEDSTGPGGIDRLRSYVEEYEFDNASVRKKYLGMNKGGAVKKPKMNKGGAVHTDYRKKGLFR
jgi:hypothetical protein